MEVKKEEVSLSCRFLLSTVNEWFEVTDCLIPLNFVNPTLIVLQSHKRSANCKRIYGNNSNSVSCFQHFYNYPYASLYSA
jgi:hypothetical protein